MIPGTVPRKKNVPSAAASVAEKNSSGISESRSPLLAEEKPPNDEASKNKNAALQNPSRRELFASIIPTFGNGLAKLLRESNNLKRDLAEIWEDKKN